MKSFTAIVALFCIAACTTTHTPLKSAYFLQPASGDVFRVGDSIIVEWESLNMPKIGFEVERVAGGRREVVEAGCSLRLKHIEQQDNDIRYRGQRILRLYKNTYPTGTAYEIRLVHPEWPCGYHTTGIYDMVRFFVSD